MFAKKMLVATLLTVALAGCGANRQYQAPLPGDGTYDAPITDSESPYEDPTSGPLPPSSAPAVPPAATTTTPATSGFVLKGIVSDQVTGKAIAGARISIGAQTMLTSAQGAFEFTGITDAQVLVDVTVSGYDPIVRFAQTFTAAAPVADKAFKLAPRAGGDIAVGTGGFSHLGVIADKQFKSVSSMVVADGTLYVLGVRDGFLWFDKKSVVAYDAASGEEQLRVSKTGAFSSLPKDTEYLEVDESEIAVSNGTTCYVYDLSGKLLRKTTGGRFDAVKQVEDETRKVVYELVGPRKVEVHFEGGSKESHVLKDVTAAKAIGLSLDGELLVLDGGSKSVHRFAFTKSE